MLQSDNGHLCRRKGNMEMVKQKEKSTQSGQTADALQLLEGSHLHSNSKGDEDNMNKYTGEIDFSEVAIKMINGLEDVSKRQCRIEEKISQFIFRMESEKTKYSNACYEIDKILSMVCDLHERDMKKRIAEADDLGKAIDSLQRMDTKRNDLIREIDQLKRENAMLSVNNDTLHKDADES